MKSTLEATPEMSYGEKLAEKRTRARLLERALWEAYRLGELTPEQMKAYLRAMATQQIEELPCESYH